MGGVDANDGCLLVRGRSVAGQNKPRPRRRKVGGHQHERTSVERKILVPPFQMRLSVTRMPIVVKIVFAGSQVHYAAVASLPDLVADVMEMKVVFPGAGKVGVRPVLF